MQTAVALTHALNELGVRHAFGVSGGPISQFWQALSASAVRVTHFRHESGAAFAAAEASLATGAPVVVFVTGGPGVTNAITGMYAARHEDARVILVSGYTDPARHGRRPMQETSPGTLPHEGLYTAGPWFDHARVLLDPAELPEVIGELAEGLSRRTGFVAHLGISLAAQNAPAPPLPPSTVRPRPSADLAEAAARAYKLLRGSDWLLWTGWGAREAAAEVRELARAAGVPVMSTPRGKGVFPEDDPAYLGVTGFAGHARVTDHLARRRPDHTLVLGTQMGDFSSGYHPNLVPAKGFLQVDLADKVADTMPAATVLPIQADVAEFCAALTALIKADGPPKPLPPLPPAEHPPVRTDGPLVDPAHLISAVQQVFTDRGVPVLAEPGNAMAWAIRQLRITHPGSWRLASGMVTSMGHSVTGVVGAALATGRKAVALAGDGAMLMNNEISTAVATEAPAVWVVLNDSRYNMCEQGAAILGLAEVDCRIPATDFAALARAQGAHGLTVATPSDLLPALTEALICPDPCVVDVRIDPDRTAPTLERNASLLWERR